MCVSNLAEVLSAMLLSPAEDEPVPAAAALPEALPVAALGETALPAVTAGTIG